MSNKPLLVPVIVAALLTVTASAAQAGADPFVLALEDLTRGTGTIITDQVAPLPGVPGDSNTAPDRILFMGKVGAFDVTIGANTYLPGPSGAPVQMNLSNFRVTSRSAGKLRVTLWRTGLSSPLLGRSVVGAGIAGATLTARGHLTVKSWVDGGTVFQPASKAMTGGTRSGTSMPVLLNGTFDLLTVVDLTFDSGGTMTASTDLQVRNAAAAGHKIVVGDGTAARCTEAALLDALEAARLLGNGTIRFRCGPAPVTIALTWATDDSAPVMIPDNTTINGGGLVTIGGGYRPIRIDPDASVRLKELSVEFGRVDNLGALTIESSVFSKGIQSEVVNYGTLIIKNSTFRDQGGLRWPISNYGTATVNHSEFLNNFGVFGNAGGLAVENSIFSNNFADPAGAILNQGGTVTIDDSEFSDNGGNDGGAITSSGALTIKKSRFFRNEVINGPGGGAISNYGGSLSSIIGSTFAGNSAFLGGAVNNTLGPLHIRNSTFTGNHAGYGGAIYSEDALTITRSTITANTADEDGGGIYVNGGPAPTLSHTSVTGNTPNNVVVAP